MMAENENPNDQAINQITTTYINNEQDHQTTPILRCDPSDPISNPTPLQLRDCADGSIDCAALTTSTTTTFNSNCDFDSDFQASNFNSKQHTCQQETTIILAKRQQSQHMPTRDERQHIKIDFGQT